ncbi:MAG: HD domain-containing protein [Acidobacteria bacterium]|nr:HD domain-containing protein [Thermoanaerobaculia bacterium]MDI9632154.1 HD domain-containing protein [Acidobacteriota bacterium]OQC38863.1 MAG: Cyclic di-GMP phosphodiesterase response regulator RpfG [Acidobacteria bacterium ADurb.Bin051]MBP7812825.1 HD domain-containing protein [Thermoanaerobaculia bacterium]NLN11556.1 HD domain-containing protein [Acidobacteriota bacterium]
MSLQAVQAILAALTTGITTRAIYPRNHPRVRQAAADLITVFGETLRAVGKEELTILVVGDELVVDDRPMRQAALFQESLLRGLQRRSVERLTLGAGLAPEEAAALLDGLSGAGELANSPHVTLGRVRLGYGEEDDGIAADDGPEEPDAEPEQKGLQESDIEAVRAAFALFATDRAESIRRLRQLLPELVVKLARMRRTFYLLPAAEEPDERLSVHSVNVALLAIVFGQALGFDEALLAELGFAALFHDIGKLELPAELRRPGRPLSPSERALFERHPELGAATLATTEEAGTLSVVVAYEHHLRWDGEPSYPPRQAPARAPGLASQLTAVVDLWDVALALAPAPGAAARAYAREALVAAAGTRLDPWLAGRFLSLVSGPGAPP